MNGSRAPRRVVATADASKAIEQLVAEHGPVMFFQSGGCCDGSLPLCFEQSEFIIGSHDVLLGQVAGCPFYIDHRQFEVWKHTQVILGVAEGEPEGFSLAAGRDSHFVITSRVFTDDELRALDAVEEQAPPDRSVTG